MLPDGLLSHVVKTKVLVAQRKDLGTAETRQGFSLSGQGHVHRQEFCVFKKRDQWNEFWPTAWMNSLRAAKSDQT